MGLHDRSRLAANQTASNVTGSDVHRIDQPTDEKPDPGIRCMRCRHPLTVARSVRVGLGPECRRIMLELLQAAS